MKQKADELAREILDLAEREGGLLIDSLSDLLERRLSGMAALPTSSSLLGTPPEPSDMLALVYGLDITFPGAGITTRVKYTSEESRRRGKQYWLSHGYTVDEVQP